MGGVAMKKNPKVIGKIPGTNIKIVENNDSVGTVVWTLLKLSIKILLLVVLPVLIFYVW